MEAKIVSGDLQPAPDHILQKTLAKAHLWRNALCTGQSLSQIAKAHKISESYIRIRLPLAMLSPKIQKSIQEGTQPRELTAKRLAQLNLPLDWGTQEQMLGLE